MSTFQTIRRQNRSVRFILLLAASAGWIAIPSHVWADCRTTDIQTLINQAASGSTVNVPPCVNGGVYRGDAITINKPLTLNGVTVNGQMPEIHGSEIWTGWTSQGSLWVSQTTVPPLNPGNPGDYVCDSASNGRCAWPEQVFIDGQPLFQVAVGVNPTTGQFSLDSARHVILADNPAGHQVEVTQYTRWVYTAADNVTIQNFVMRHCANASQTSAINHDNHTNWTLQDSVLSDAHAIVVGLGSSNVPVNVSVLRNDISRGGDLGLAGYQLNGGLIQGNKIHDNNTEAFLIDWQAGGVKIAAYTGTIVDHNQIYNNNGVGLWCDIGCSNVVWSSNTVHDNVANGIQFEISTGAKIFGNIAWGNAIDIAISSSQNAEVFKNTVAWTASSGTGIRVWEDNRSDKPGPSTGNYVHDNVMIENTGALASGWWECSGCGLLQDSTNHGTNGLYWYLGGQSTETSGQFRFQWENDLWSLASYNSPATQGDSNGQYMTDAQKNQILAANCMPPSPGAAPSCSGGTFTANLTSPANGNAFAAPASIPLTATASDSGGTITKVEFFQGTTSLGLGTLTGGSYCATWHNVSSGTYSLTAQATDNMNAVAISSPISITALAPITVPFRINAGGPALPGGWQEDDAALRSPYVTHAGNEFASTTNAITLSPSVPAGTPMSLLQTERYDSTGLMSYVFPVNPGMYQVRLYFSENFSGAQAVGARTFNVLVQGQPFLTNYDTFADAGGGYIGVMKSTFTSVAGGMLQIAFSSGTAQLPRVMGLEISTSTTSTPFQGMIPVPGRVVAVNFDNGGEGVAYHDLDPLNQGDGNYRVGEGVDIKTLAGGGYRVGDFQGTEWLQYSIHVAAAGNYQVAAHMANTVSGATLHLELDGQPLGTAIAVPNTGSYDTFQYSPVQTVSLPSGNHFLRIVADGPSGGYIGDLDYVTVSSTALGGLPARPTGFRIRS